MGCLIAGPKRGTIRAFALACGVVCIGPFSAAAQSLSTQQIQEILTGPDEPAAEAATTLAQEAESSTEAINRILQMEIPSQPSGTRVPQMVEIDTGRSLDLVVEFALNSAQLTPEAETQLMALGEALVSASLRQERFLVAGHTDAGGSDAYNLALSERRAQSVRSFLRESFDIPEDRLVAVGFGETNLAIPDRPNEGANRRVEVSVMVNSHINSTGDTK